MSEKVYGKKLLELIPKLDFLLDYVFSHTCDSTSVRTKEFREFINEVRDTIQQETHPDFQMEERNKRMDRKPPLGCKPYYVVISERVDELCDAIRRSAGEKCKHNQVKLWTHEIHLLNEMDRMLRRVEAEKTWVEDKDGMLKEAE